MPLYSVYEQVAAFPKELTGDLRAALAGVQRLFEHQAPKEPSINGEI
jgi:hypothetical protein